MTDIFASGGDAVLAVDLPGMVIYSNRPAEALTGRGRDDLLGRPMASTFAAAADAGARLTRHAIGERRPIGPVTGWILDHGESRLVTVECYATPIHGRDGSISGAVLVLRESRLPSS